MKKHFVRIAMAALAAATLFGIFVCDRETFSLIRAITGVVLMILGVAILGALAYGHLKRPNDEFRRTDPPLKT